MKTYMLLSACLLLLGSCQKKTENTDTVVSDTTSTTTATPEETTGDDGEFCYLKVISKDSIILKYTRTSDRSINDLLTEMSALRHANIMMFKSFTTEDLMRKGTASGNAVSVRAFGFLIIGHQNHHMKVFKERYL